MTTPAKSAKQRHCKECQVPLLPDWPDTLCAQCLLKYANAKSKDESEFNEIRWRNRAPTVDEIASLFPQLEINKLIGQGGMGWVYKARQPGLDRLVCLKILSPKLSHDRTFAERFIREAKAMARLSHPNIISVYDFGISAGCFYFVMELVDGMDLRELLQNKKPTAEESLKMISQICDALHYAHDEGVIHRDIKPGNILIDKRGRVKIADFGLAKLLGPQPKDMALTQSLQTMGTPHYMAPEQTEKPSEVDHRADIYSLGVVFYELLTGELPLGRFAPPSQKADIDPRLDDVVLRTLEKEPQRRYQQASEVKSRVESILHTPAVPPTESPPVTVVAPPPPQKTWSRWLVPAVSVLCILAISFSYEKRLRELEAVLKKNEDVLALVDQAKLTDETPPITEPRSASAPGEKKATPDASSNTTRSAHPRVFKEPLIFFEDFESADLSDWQTLPAWKGEGKSTPLHVSLAKNHTPGGDRCAEVKLVSDKLEYQLSRHISEPARVTFWIYTRAQARAYGEVVGLSGSNVRLVLSIGRHFPALPDSNWDTTSQPDSFQARIVSKPRNSWFNLDATDSADFSEDWHKFEIEIHPERNAVIFTVDGKPGRTVANVQGLSFDAIRIGSIGVGEAEYPAWFDDVKVELLETPATNSEPKAVEIAPAPVAETKPAETKAADTKPATEPARPVPPPPPLEPGIVFRDDFESGDLKHWVQIGTALSIATEENHTVGGSHCAALGKTSDKMSHRFEDPKGPVKATFWIRAGTHDRIYGQIRCFDQQVLSIGRFHLTFPTGEGVVTDEVMDENFFQGRIGRNAGWFNLNAPGAPKYSPGWHKFEIERLADGITYNFHVDGVLSRQIKDKEHPWAQVEIGSSGSGSATGTGWFDDIQIESVKASQ